MPELGDTLGRYTLLKRLATGGMGEIFLAARMGPLGFASPVALKVLRDELATDVTFIEMLVDEAKISMFLNHQNVVSVQDFGEENGRYYIAMEFVQGVTLKNVLDAMKAKGRRLDLSTGAYISNELCRALKYAHTRTNHAGEPLNIVHRDVTPANVLISIQGEVKLTDFGIARAKNRVHQTQAGVLKGKFGYMAPEMLRYEQIDARADLFCAGVMFYEMAAGQHPVEGASIMEAITRLEEKDIRPPSTFNPKVPRELDALIMKALEPKPAQRWLSAHEISTAIQDLGFIDASRRIEMRHGAEQITALMRELFPTVFEPALPREHAEKMLALARERSSLSPLEGGHPGLLNGPGPSAPSRKLPAEQDEDPHPEKVRSGRVSVRPVINPTAPSRDLSRDLSRDSSRMATREASAIQDDHEPATIIPRAGRSHTPATAALLEPDTDEHARNLMEAAAAAQHSDRTTNLSADDVRRGTPGAGGDEPDIPTSEIVIRFPDSSTDRSRLREELLAEPDRPSTKDKSKPTPAPERTDDATVAGMALPDWGAGRDESLVQLLTPAMDPEESGRDFEEGELQRVQERSSSYDDGATAFSGPEGYEPQATYSDDKTAFGMQATSRPDESTIIPDADLRDPQIEKFTDDTLLDGLSRADIDKAKAELASAKSRIKFEHQDDDMVADTSLRQDALIDEIPSPTLQPPKKPLGRTASNASGERPSPAPAVSTTPSPIKRPVVTPPGRPAAREVPRPVAPDPASRPAGPGPNAPAEIGSATGRWMRGELQAQDLSWGDDAAARRAVATRNQGASQPPAPDPRRTNVGAPRPGQQTQGGYPTPQQPQQPAMMPQGSMFPGQMGPNGMGGQMGPNGMGGQIPFPAAPPPRRTSRGLTVGLALATVMVAIAAVATVLLRTKIAWPEVTFETEPPGAQVRIDDKMMGERTPSTFAIRPSVAHRVEVRLEGYAPREVPGVELGYFSAHKHFQIALERLMPKIRISPVEGRVFVNDNLIGSGYEVVLANVDPGIELKVRIEAEGHLAWSQTFQRLADIPASLDIPLKPQPPPDAPPKRRER